MRLGVYEVLGPLSRGGAGSVLRARAPDGSTVAIKVLNRTTEESLARFERERRLLECLGADEGFVPLLDAGTGPQGPFIVMPLLEGGTLRQRLEKGPMSLDEAVALARTLADAVGRAHERGLIHRDLKPENVLYDREGRPKVADLGLAKHFERETPGASRSVALTQDGAFRGTAGYMALEQMVSAKDVGPPADVFALGAILYECLAGRPAFGGDTLGEVILKVQGGAPASLRRLRPEAPRWLEEVVARCLATDAARRFPDARALAAALTEQRASRRRPFAVLAVFAIALVAAAAFVHARRGEAEPAKVASPPPPPPEEPSWFLALPKADRPALPLPRGLVLGKTAGEYVNEKDGTALVYIPADTFIMGDDQRGGTDERPAHEVNLSAHFMGKYEVTNARFEAFVAATGYRTRAEEDGGGATQKGFYETRTPGTSWRQPHPGEKPAPDLPVVQVALADAEAYLRWAGLRLPTEAEWEHACRWDRKAGKGRMYPWGDGEPGASPVGNLPDLALERVESDARFFKGYDDGFAGLAPVGSFPEGMSPWGIHDMAGNAAEWVADAHAQDFYAKSPRNDPVCRSGDGVFLHTVRGGSFHSRPAHAQGWWRHQCPADSAIDDLGFRAARNGL